jgi:hypothetical protein
MELTEVLEERSIIKLGASPGNVHDTHKWKTEIRRWKGAYPALWFFT